MGREVAGMAAGAEAVGLHLNLKHKIERLHCVCGFATSKPAPRIILLSLAPSRTKDQVFKYLRLYRNILIQTTTVLSPLSLLLPLGLLLRYLYIGIRFQSLVKPLDLVFFFVTIF